MLWDCPCGTSGLLGVDHRHCPNCGRPQDPKRRYFPDQKDAKPAPEWLSSYGVDHYCPYCQTANSSKATFCAGCGGPMDGSKEVELRDTQIGEAAETVADADAEARREAQERREAVKTYHTPSARKAREETREAPSPSPDHVLVPRELSVLEDSRTPRNLTWDQYRKPAVLTGAFLLVGLVFWAFFFWEKTITVSVQEQTWQRSQGIQRYMQLDEEAWCSRAPQDRYNNRSRKKQRGTKTVVDCRDCDCHTERVKTGQTCRDTNCHTVRRDNGNGSFSSERVCTRTCDPVYENQRVCQDRTHQEPVYDNWCEYNIDRWRERRRPTMSGGGSVKPSWPKLTYKKCVSPTLGCERPGSRRERYQVRFQDVDTGEKYECLYPKTEWVNYNEGSVWIATVKVIGGRFQCDTLQPLERP